MVETLEDLCDGCAAIETIKTPEYPQQNKFQSAVMLIGALVLPAHFYICSSSSTRGMHLKPSKCVCSQNREFVLKRYVQSD